MGPPGLVLWLLAVLGGPQGGQPFWEKALRLHGWVLVQTYGWVREPCDGRGLTNILNTEFLGVNSEGRYQEGLICCEGPDPEKDGCTLTVYDKVVVTPLLEEPSGLIIDDRSVEEPEEPPSVPVPPPLAVPNPE